MPVHKYFCPECGLVLQSGNDVTNQSVKCLGCQAVFIAQPMNRPSAAESAVLRAPAPPKEKPKTDVLKPLPAPTPSPAPSAVRPADPPAQRPSVVRKPDPPAPVPILTPAPRAEPPPADPPRRKTSPPPPPPPASNSGTNVRRRPAPPADEDEEIISLAPVRKKKRWPLVVVLLGVFVVFAGGGAVALWYFVFSGSPEMKFKAEAPDKAWTVRLPDAPTTSDVKDDNKEYSYTRPGKDAEFAVTIKEAQAASPDETLDLDAGSKFAEAAMKYKLDALAAAMPKAEMSKYDGQYPRRLFEIDTGSRGKLTVQVIVVNWNSNKSTTITQVAIGMDVSDSERKAFLNSVEIRKASR